MFVGHGGGRVDRFRRTSSAALAWRAGGRRTREATAAVFFVPSSTFDPRYSPRCSYHDCVLSLHFRPNIYKKSRLIYCAAASRAEPRHRAWAPPSNFPRHQRKVMYSRASFPPCATRSAGGAAPERGSRTSGVHFARNTPRRSAMSHRAVVTAREAHARLTAARRYSGGSAGAILKSPHVAPAARTPVTGEDRAADLVSSWRRSGRTTEGGRRRR